LRDEGYNPQSVLEVLRMLELAPTIRAETLPVSRFIELSRRVRLPHRHAE
jgi:hypothetical protein